MKETVRTLAFAAVAAALALAALFTGGPTARSPETFGDQGKPFYPSFTDPLLATSLEVVSFNEATGSADFFKVEFKDGKWVIPSHHNYPADAKDRLRNTASAVIGLARGAFCSDKPRDFESFGVVAPLDPQAGLKGRGRRVTLCDKNGQKLADFIFGKEARGDEAGMRYVRLPEQNRVYTVKTKVDISVKFEDWIETDLLQVSQGAVRKVVIDSYSIDEQKGEIKDRSTQQLARPNSSDPWKLEGMKEGEELNTDAVNEMMNALDDLKITGVRLKPEFLTRDLKAKGEFMIKERVTPQQMQGIQSLQQKGYYFVREGEGKDATFSIASNEGEVQASCDDGIVYTLRFGEVLIGEGEDVTAGKEDEVGPKKPEPKEGKKEGKENRYLFVTARFDEPLLGAPPAAPDEVKPDPARKPEDQKAAEEKYKKDKEEYDSKKKDFDKKVEDGRKRAQELTDRFAQWYYVISADYFRKLRRGRADLIKAKEPPKDEKKPEEKK